MGLVTCLPRRGISSMSVVASDWRVGGCIDSKQTGTCTNDLCPCHPFKCFTRSAISSYPPCSPATRACLKLFFFEKAAGYFWSSFLTMFTGNHGEHRNGWGLLPAQTRANPSCVDGVPIRKLHCRGESACSPFAEGHWRQASRSPSNPRAP